MDGVPKQLEWFPSGVHRIGAAIETDTVRRWLLLINGGRVGHLLWLLSTPFGESGKLISGLFPTLRNSPVAAQGGNFSFLRAHDLRNVDCCRSSSEHRISPWSTDLLESSQGEDGKISSSWETVGANLGHQRLCYDTSAWDRRRHFSVTLQLPSILLLGKRKVRWINVTMAVFSSLQWLRDFPHYRPRVYCFACAMLVLCIQLNDEN